MGIEPVPWDHSVRAHTNMHTLQLCTLAQDLHITQEREATKVSCEETLQRRLASPPTPSQYAFQIAAFDLDTNKTDPSSIGSSRIPCSRLITAIYNLTKLVRGGPKSWRKRRESVIRPASVAMKVGWQIGSGDKDGHPDEPTFLTRSRAGKSWNTTTGEDTLPGPRNRFYGGSHF